MKQEAATLSDAICGRENNFDLLRTAAAMAVIFSHSYALTGVRGEPFAWLNGAYSASKVAVCAFFILSGFLIARSWSDDPRLLAYAAKRLSRIVPAYAAVTLFSALVLGPLFTTLSLGDYFGSKTTWSYIKYNLLFYKMQYVLPGVFADLKYPNAVNGSIWSLAVEMYLYILVPLLGSIGCLLKGWGRHAILLLVAGLLITEWHAFQTPGSDSLVFFHQLVRPGLRCALCFAIGSCFYVYRDSIPLSTPLAVFATAILVGSWRTPYASLALFACLPYLTFWLAFRPSAVGRRFSQWGDPSYGLYIYAFPAQQMLLHFFPEMPVLLHFLVSVAVVMPLAYLSWHLLERPILQFTRRRLRRAEQQQQQQPESAVIPFDPPEARAA